MRTAGLAPQALAEVEERESGESMDRGLADLTARLQEMADAMPCEGSDGRRLRRTRRIGMEVDTALGKARLSVPCGQCRSTRKWETPFRDRLFRGERGAVSPALERGIVTTVCETGSFEKAAKVCGAWGCEPGDDKAMTTVRRVGDACEAAKAPGLCDCAAGKDGVLTVMMDGRMARYREAKWGRRGAPPCERVGWHEVKSAVMFRLPQVAEVSRGRRGAVPRRVAGKGARRLDAQAPEEPQDMGPEDPHGRHRGRGADEDGGQGAERDGAARAGIFQEPQGAHGLQGRKARRRPHRKRRDGVAVPAEPEPVQAQGAVLVESRLRVIHRGLCVVHERRT